MLSDLFVYSSQGMYAFLLCFPASAHTFIASPGCPRSLSCKDLINEKKLQVGVSHKGEEETLEAKTWITTFSRYTRESVGGKSNVNLMVT